MSDRRGGAADGPHPHKGETPLSADLPVKRKRSRKGLGKRFECTADGCGKSYSRAEHLYRHQLNHNSRQIFYCQYPDCPRSFVRGDLLKRHMDRHAARGPHLGRRDSMAGHPAAAHSSSASDPASAEPKHFDGGCSSSIHQPPLHYHSPQAHSGGSPYTPVGTTPPDAHRAATPNAHAAEAYGQDAALEHPQSRVTISQNSPAAPSCLSIQPSLDSYDTFPLRDASQSGYHANTIPHPSASFVPQQDAAASMRLPSGPYHASQAVVSPRDPGQPYMEPTSAPYLDAVRATPADMVTLDQMAMPGTGPVFGDDGSLNKSPYVGMPEDFMAYLFNSLPGGGSCVGIAASTAASNYGDLQSHQYPHSYLGDDGAPTGHFPTKPQRVMAVNNLLDQNAPEANLSEEKSEELFDFIRDRFHENDLPPIERQRESIIGGDRSQANHVLSRRRMQAYICSYWYHFSDQMPILHKPTFSSDQTPNLLLLAMMTLGAACLDRTHDQQMTTADARISDFLARHLRWEIFMDWNFRPPAKLWVFQALILLELYEKMYSTRELHERAHIHHATTITLMRRGRSLIGKSSLDSPPNPRESQSGAKRASAGGAAQTAEEWWHHWIAGEATRRAAFAAFIVDTTHATMFGHSGVMAAHEMRLALPCDESLWRATSSAEVARIEANLASEGIKPTSFLEGLKRTLSHQEVRTTSFGRTVLMAGLLSVTYHMHQRDLQVNVLGGGVTHALGGRDKWRATLKAAYDSWKASFDKALEQSEPSSDPYRHDAVKHVFNIVFASRTVLHHLAHMAMHADIVDCQIFARAKRLLGRTISPQEFGGAQRRIRDTWAHTARARDAAYYALKFLSSVLQPETDRAPGAQEAYPDRPYEARYDVLMNRPWVLYFAALVVWCYGFALEGPCPDAGQAATADEVQREMQAYLFRFSGMAGPGDLQSLKGVNENTALLMVLKESFERTQWDLLHEAAHLLRNCIMLNTGGTLA
ncbi:hypothetical protein CDD83_8654 [Cordyceps sp. RAO-2017]|nr:hypothetical protein CDD83_8654 [Cordyceps sp. RAO-2017]